MVLILCFITHKTQAQEWQSEIVYEGADGRLIYVADEENNRIPDFSHAGYRGGGIELPGYPVVKTISPVEGDNTDHIQQAIDEVSAFTPDANGVRGALLLAAGLYEVSRSLNLRESGVVLRGVGNGEDETSNTIIKRTGTTIENVIQIGSGISDNAWQEMPGTRSNITSEFVQIGARSFAVAEPDLYSVGDQVIVLHPLSESWLASVDGGGTDSDPPWQTDEFDIAYTRHIVHIKNDSLFINAPVFNHLDRSLTQSYVYKRDNTGEIQEVGIENLRIEIDTRGPLAEDHARSAVEFVHVAHAWATQVTALHFVYAGIDVRRSIHVTVRDSEALLPHSEITGGRRYNFAVYRSQLVLFENNLATEGRHNYVGNGEGWDSGIVFLNNISQDAHSTSEPHRHWGQGFLYDNHQEIGTPLRPLRIRLGNRGSFGTGHGWSAVHSVAWNCKMNGTSVSVEKPPTAQNYAIGCEGNITGTGGSFRQPGGYIEGANRPGISPASLYIKQLADRQAVPLPIGDINEMPSSFETRFLAVTNYPNPFSEQTTIRVQLEQAGELVLDVFDILGRHITTLSESTVSAGIHEFPISDAASSGIYVVRARYSNGGQHETQFHKLVTIYN